VLARGRGPFVLPHETRDVPRCHPVGVDSISVRGYDLLGDAIDVGRYVLPLIRDEDAKRDTEQEVPV
jgi:hypothetical protein